MKIVLSFAVVSVLLALVAIGLYVHQFPGPFSDEQAVWGSFGDFIAGVANPLIAISALAALLETLRVQRIEFKDVRKELAYQRFDTRFFRLLDSVRSTVRDALVLERPSAWDVPTEPTRHEGPGAFSMMMMMLIEDYDHAAQSAGVANQKAAMSDQQVRTLLNQVMRLQTELRGDLPPLIAKLTAVARYLMKEEATPDTWHLLADEIHGHARSLVALYLATYGGTGEPAWRVLYYGSLPAEQIPDESLQRFLQNLLAEQSP